MSDATPDAPDTGASSQVTDHLFDPVGGDWWAICKICRLGRAAHTGSLPGSERPANHIEERPTPLPVGEIDLSEMQEHVVGDGPVCGVPGPAPSLSCELLPDHPGLHTGIPGGQNETARVRWGEPPAAEQDDPIGGGRGYSLRQRDEEYEAHEMAAVGSIDHLHQDHVHPSTAGRKLVDGERQEQHGDPVPNMERIARGWSIIAEAAITPQMVPLMMVWFKIVRESQNHGEDNLDDIEGYTEIMRRVVKELGP